MNDSNIRRFAKVKSENSNSVYILSILNYKTAPNTLGCSCMAWRITHPRKDCKHIKELLEDKIDSKRIEVLDKEILESLQFIQKL